MDFNLSVRSTDPSGTQFIDLSGTENVDQTTGTETLTLVGNATDTNILGIQTSQAFNLKLSGPVGDLSSIDPQQLTSAVNSLRTPLSALGACHAMLGTIMKALDTVLDNLKSNAPETYLDAVKRDDLANFFNQAGRAAGQTSDKLYSMLQNAYYQQNSKFISSMIEVAQQLRQLSNLARQEAIQGEFTTMLDEASQMMTQAQDTYNGEMADITASDIEAGFQIFSGLTSIVSGGFGMKAESESSATAISTTGQGVSGLTTGIGTLIANSYKMQGAADRLAAGMAGAAEKVLEAAQKKLEQQENIAADLNQTAIGLLDAMLKLQQSIADSQNQTMSSIHV
jgi:hypothetical protein